MEIIEKFAWRCRKNPKKILFPDALDERVIKAARYLCDKNLAVPVLLGGPIEVREFAERAGLSTRGIKIHCPLHDKNYDKYAEDFYQLKKQQKITKYDVLEIMRNPLYFAAMMLRNGGADMCIAGNLSPASEALEAAVQIIGAQEENKTVSSFLLMSTLDGQSLFIFSDCNMIAAPTPEQLCDIALSAAENYQKLTGQEARVAILSFSTKGSAEHPMSEKTRRAAEIVKEKNPFLIIDGDLQFDAAVLPEVANKKAPDSEVGGKANVFIFPSLNAGNIGYQIAEQLGGYQALGPFIQGLNKPMHNLSRACTVEDIINMSIAASCMA
jgi:phosphotransacetylase